MAYPGLRAYIDRLKKENELLVIEELVSPELEITEITDRISKLPDGGKALLFTNTGTAFPLLINSLGSARRMCLALGTGSLDEPGERVRKLIGQFSSPGNSLFAKLKMLPRLRELASIMPQSIKGRGKCQEVVNLQPDLSIMPILKCWPFDGGRFITLPLVHTLDPDTGIRNVGMYRMQIFSSNETGMHWHRHKTGARHFEAYKRLGKKMPIAVALGGDPVYNYVATAPLPDNMDEYMFAGFLRGEKVKLVKCITQEIEVPADTDFIIEGYVDPSEELVVEGPFGDHTGFYSMPDMYPRFHVSCITHRRDAVYPATIVGIPPQEDAWIALATERIFLIPLQLTVLNELLDMYLPPMGVAHNLAIVKINKSYPGQAIKVMNALWGAGQMMFNKFLIIVDGDTDVHDYTSVLQAIISNTRISTDIHFSSGPLDVLDHSSINMSFGGKLAIDATSKLPEEAAGIPGIKPDNIQNKPNQPSDGVLPPYVAGINEALMDAGIPVLIIKVKQEKPSPEDLGNELALLLEGRSQGCLLLIDEHVQLADPGYLLWYCLNNIDPARDCRIVRSREGFSLPAILLVDAMVKDIRSGYNKRLWPNAICSSDGTINFIDTLWDKLKIGNFIPSPSLQFKGLIRKAGPAI